MRSLGCLSSAVRCDPNILPKLYPGKYSGLAGGSRGSVQTITNQPIFEEKAKPPHVTAAVRQLQKTSVMTVLLASTMESCGLHFKIF